MTGAPWHCGAHMQIIGHFNKGAANEWVSWMCQYCRHRETTFGRLEGDKFVAVRRTLTVLMCSVPNGVLCRGISNDDDIFNNVLYVDENTAVQALGKFYSVRGFRCVFDLPKKGPKP